MRGPVPQPTHTHIMHTHTHIHMGELCTIVRMKIRSRPRSRIQQLVVFLIEIRDICESPGKISVKKKEGERERKKRTQRDNVLLTLAARDLL